MFEQIFDFLFSWWGLLALFIILIIELLIEGTIMGKRVRDLIFLAEELSRRQVLKTGQEKFEWVKANGYQYLPPILKTILSEHLFGLIVQAIFDKIMEWANSKKFTDVT